MVNLNISYATGDQTDPSIYLSLHNKAKDSLLDYDLSILMSLFQLKRLQQQQSSIVILLLNNSQSCQHSGKYKKDMLLPHPAKAGPPRRVLDVPIP